VTTNSWRLGLHVMHASIYCKYVFCRIQSNKGYTCMPSYTCRCRQVSHMQAWRAAATQLVTERRQRVQLAEHLRFKHIAGRVLQGWKQQVALVVAARRGAMDAACKHRRTRVKAIVLSVWHKSAQVGCNHILNVFVFECLALFIATTTITAVHT
jgi:hypothetical protein